MWYHVNDCGWGWGGMWLGMPLFRGLAAGAVHCSAM